MDVFEIVKAKIPAEKLPNYAEINMNIAEVGQYILTYCNLSVIPKELEFTHANMVIDLITGNARRNDTESQGNVKTIKEGDTTVTLETTRAASTREAQMETLLFDYASQLNRFRKLRW